MVVIDRLAEIFPNLLLWMITGSLGAFFMWVRRKLGIQKAEQEQQREAIAAEQEAFRDGLQAILHDRIYQAHRYYTQLGFCPLNDKKNIEYLFRPYAALGGNGTGKQAFDDIMNLPTERLGGKENT